MGGQALRRIEIPSTVEVRVFDELRLAILSGALEPGTLLPIGQLASDLDVSTMPVRSALTRLRGEGLVVQEARRGTKVAPLEFAQLEEIQAVRSGIECLAVRVGITALDANRLAMMEDRLAELVTVAGDDELGRYLDAEWRFRETCLAASGRARLLSLIADYRNRAARYLRVAFAGPGGLRDSISFQEVLLDACRRGDAESAEAVIREALEWTVRAVRPFFAGGTASEKPRRAHREPAQSRLAN